MSHLIIGGNESQRKEKAVRMAREEFKSKNFDIALYPQEDGAITILDARKAKRSSLLKPIASENKTYIFWELNRAAAEAQNALLKLIEEPPAQTEIVITSPNEYLLPPPLVSRCLILKIGSATKELALAVNFKKENEFLFLLTAGISERLEKAEKIAKEKGLAAVFLKQIIVEARFLLLAKEGLKNFALPKKQDFESRAINELISIIKKLQKGLETLENTNTSERLLLENLLLEFTPG